MLGVSAYMMLLPPDMCRGASGRVGRSRRGPVLGFPLGDLTVAPKGSWLPNHRQVMTKPAPKVPSQKEVSMSPILSLLTGMSSTYRSRRQVQRHRWQVHLLLQQCPRPPPRPQVKLRISLLPLHLLSAQVLRLGPRLCDHGRLRVVMFMGVWPAVPPQKELSRWSKTFGLPKGS